VNTAQTISALLNDDGQVFAAADGRTLEDLTEAHGATITTPNGAWDSPTPNGAWARYVFGDGSVITVVGNGWDLGYPDCYCWQGVGHNDCVAEEQ